MEELLRFACVAPFDAFGGNHAMITSGYLPSAGCQTNPSLHDFTYLHKSTEVLRIFHQAFPPAWYHAVAKRADSIAYVPRERRKR